MIRTKSGRLVAQGITILRTAAGASSVTTTTNNQNSGKRQQNTAASEPGFISNSDKYLHYSPEEGYYKTSPYDVVSPLDITLDKYVWSDFQKWENKIATVCVVTGRHYTFAELRDRSAAFAVRLRVKFKLNARDVVAVCLPNLPEYPLAVLGALEAGLTVTTVNPIYTADEISRQLLFSDAKFIIGTIAGFPILRKACELAKKQLPIVCIRTRLTDELPAGAIDFSEILSTNDIDYSQANFDDVTADDMAFLPFSSGTTGLPKGVMLTHNNITVNCDQIKVAVPMNPNGQQDVVPAVLPFFHIYGLTAVMLSKLALGCKLVTFPQFKPEDLLKSLYEYKGSVLNLVPPIAHLLTNHPKVTAASAPNLRVVMSGAAPIGASDVERFLKKFPNAKFVQGYGMTESSPVTLMTSVNNTRYSSVGYLTGSTEGKIVAIGSEGAKGVGPNVTGELCVRGPQVMQGYIDNEEANREAFYPGKWLRTGDVAYYDDDGYFYITDRMKELIKVKGFQVPPAELEEILRNHPSILEAAVIGIPHEQYGEIPRAIVALKPNSEAKAEEICDFVAEKVAHYKKLEGGVIFVSEIPKNASGKILRRELKEKFSS